MTRCPYCGGIAKRITCGAAECQASLNRDRRASPEFQQWLAEYRQTPEIRAYQKAYHASDKAKAARLLYEAGDEVKAARRAYEASDEAKAKRRARYLRLKEAASDAAKLACILGAWCAAWIIVSPDTARAAAIVGPEDFTVIPNVALLTLVMVMLGSMALIGGLALLDRIKYGEVDRALLAARREQLEAENAEYAAAHGRADGE